METTLKSAAVLLGQKGGKQNVKRHGKERMKQIGSLGGKRRAANLKRLDRLATAC